MKIENNKLNIVRMEFTDELPHFLELINRSIINGQIIIKLECDKGLYTAYFQEKL